MAARDRHKHRPRRGSLTGQEDKLRAARKAASDAAEARSREQEAKKTTEQNDNQARGSFTILLLIPAS